MTDRESLFALAAFFLVGFVAGGTLAWVVWGRR